MAAASSSLRRRDLTGFVVLLAFFVLAGLTLFHSDQSGPQTVSIETIRDPSIENTRASGSRGLYEWTNRLGYRTEVWRRDFLSLPDNAQVMFCIAPAAPSQSVFFTGSGSEQDPGSNSDAPKRNSLTPEEGRSIRRWIAKGHTLILLASELPASDTDHESSFANQIGIDAQSALTNSKRTDFAPVQPTVWTQGLDAIRIHSGARLRQVDSDAVALFGDVDTIRASHKHIPAASLVAQPVVLVRQIGRGHVIAVADDEFACNANLCRAGNAQFLYRALHLSASPGATVLFDEFHRDFGGESPSVWLALGRPLQLAIVQLGLAAAVVLIVLIPRLGRPEPLARNVGRTSAEYVTSLAGLYQSAGATATALDTVYRQFLREVCTKYGLPTDVTLDRLAEVLARRGGINGGDLRKLLIACERALESKNGVPERDLITLVRAIERFRKELGIG